uniref:Uncharacterized protein n=1 Tax=Strigamia maritima TaxID=126957 RepID=T1JPI2_STRMM
MASEEDEEIFEITDFTTATEWERFIARIEEVIHEWQLTKPQHGRSLKRGDICNGKWIKRIDTITFADTRFNTIHHCLEFDDNSVDEVAVEDSGEEPLPQALEDIMSMENDFPLRAHCLSRWFGLREFVVLTPTVYTDAIISESKVKVLLSSFSIPFFVQVHSIIESYYLGVCEGGGIRTNFEMVHLQKAPQKANHLSGLLDIFKAKLASPRLNAPVSVSVRFTFVLHDWTELVWPQQPPDFDLLLGEIGIHELGQLPFGACEDPVSEFYLSTTWPCMCEDVIVDNDVYSDLDPLQAPQWSLRVNLVENPQCLLYEYLNNLVALSKRPDTVDYFLAKNSDEGNERHFSQSLDRLTDRIPLNVNVSVSSVVGKPISRRLSKPENKPIAASQLQQILDYLFPDARLKTTEKEKAKRDVSEESTNVLSRSEDTFRSLKSAPQDSLTWRLALCIAHVNHGYKSVAAVAHLWSEFVLEMRYRWEIAYQLPE